MNYQVEKIRAAQTSAFRIFTVTKKKFEDAISRAYSYIEENQKEINRLGLEQQDLKDANRELEGSIKTMEGSVGEINRIMGVQ